MFLFYGKRGSLSRFFLQYRNKRVNIYMNYSNNKYSRWYFNIIKKAQEQKRTKEDDQYYENHHIIPKSLGGGDNVQNLVLLTGREHFIAHLLLVKMLEGKQKRSMFRALIRMLEIAKDGKKYEYIRKIIANFYKGENNPAYGKIWITNPNTTDSKLVSRLEFREMYEKNGYIIGLSKQQGGFTKGSKIKINNGVVEKMLDKGEDIPEGWVFGRINPAPKTHMDNMRILYKKSNKYSSHGSKIKNRIQIVGDGLPTKRINAKDFPHYEKMGYSKKSALTQNMKPVSIDGQVFASLGRASESLKISKSTIRYRVASEIPKWRGWRLA